jgi:membrane protein YqaA with SNARE-associated domain
MEAIHELANWVISWANTPYGAVALGVIAFAESFFFPIPPDVLLIALCLIDPERSLTYSAICSGSSVLGGIFGYTAGKVGGRPLLTRLISQEKIHFVQKYYQKYDVWAVAIAGFTPIPYKVFTVTAGAFLLDLKRFILASALGRSGRFFIVGTLLFFFGKPVSLFIQKYLNLLSVLFVVLLISGFVLIHFWSRKSMSAVPKSAKPELDSKE